MGDHYRPRLTHTLEVSQIARTISKALRLNEDLTEAIALGHDLGHTPFGHAGEDTLNEIVPGGFNHADQSLRVVDSLEKEGKGLNLTVEVRDGILKHTKGKGENLCEDPEAMASTREGQVVRIADIIAYINHDIDDAIRAGVLKPGDLPPEPTSVLGHTTSEEGDPILQASTVCAAVREMRQATARGTINFNSNASLPDAVDALAGAGIDSIRVSLNSVLESRYDAYYRQRGYVFADVLESLRRAKGHGLFTMINYLVFPGVSDRREEVDALLRLIFDVGIDLIQMRNLSLDPTLYLGTLGVQGRGTGMVAMLKELKAEFPKLQYGYFNRTRENFFPAGYEADWPIA